MTSAPWQEWEGRIIDGRFPLQRFLGGNAHSAVFLTQYGEPEPRNAAIRLVRADSAEKDLPARWDRAAQLSHANLIRLFERGSCQTDQVELHYAVTEYAEEVLATVLQDRPLGFEEAHDALESILDVLAYLHAQGLVHGCLKPGNIMAVSDRLKVSCDGIRKAGESASGKSGAYDAPELRVTGFTPAGDIWSLGKSLAESLTQCLP